MDRDQDLIAIAKFFSEHDARVLQIALIDRGIKATVSGDISAFGAITGGAVGVNVYVRRIEVDEARKIMREMPDETLCPAWQCACGAMVDEGFAICWQCGNEYAENDKYRRDNEN